MEKKAYLLLLEDDLVLAETIQEFLEENHYEVLPASNGDEALDIAYEKHFDLLLLDVSVPGMDGFTLLQELRKLHIETPAIFLTSRDQVDDLAQGYQSGCDDYLKKPFELKELLLRIEALLKRSFFHKALNRIEIAPEIWFDLDSLTLQSEGNKVNLSAKESKLLKLFLQHDGELLSHEMIYEVLWDYGEEPSEFSLRSYIKNLRKWIGKEKIVSHKKLGYQYSSQ